MILSYDANLGRIEFSERTGGPDDAATALSGISEPGGEHSQSSPIADELDVRGR